MSCATTDIGFPVFRREISCPCLARWMLIVQETQILVNDHGVSLGYRLYKTETFLSKSENVTL
jgi:hypothetical protein